MMIIHFDQVDMKNNGYTDSIRLHVFYVNQLNYIDYIGDLDDQNVHRINIDDFLNYLSIHLSDLNSVFLSMMMMIDSIVDHHSMIIVRVSCHR